MVYNGDSQNLADEIIYFQLDRMNKDCRRMNENAAKTRTEFLPFSGDAMIEFVPVAADGFTENDLGRTIIHEKEDYLGLRHIWGNALLTGGCSVDDGIVDTPNQNAASSSNCNHTIKSCSDSPLILPIWLKITWITVWMPI